MPIDFEDAAGVLYRRVYEAAKPIEELQDQGLVDGNGHHARQKIAQAAVKELRSRWRAGAEVGRAGPAAPEPHGPPIAAAWRRPVTRGDELEASEDYLVAVDEEGGGIAVVTAEFDESGEVELWCWGMLWDYHWSSVAWYCPVSELSPVRAVAEPPAGIATEYQFVDDARWIKARHYARTGGVLLSWLEPSGEEHGIIMTREAARTVANDIGEIQVIWRPWPVKPPAPAGTVGLPAWATNLAADMPSEQLVELRSACEAALAMGDRCEHGVVCGDWCGPCNKEYKRARIEYGLDKD